MKRKRKLSATMAAAVVAAAAIAGGVAGITTSMASAAAKPTPTPTAAAPGGTWSTAITVPGVGFITDLTCTSPGNCLAVGDASIIAERDGAWRAPQAVPGLAALRKSMNSTMSAVNVVSCSSAGNCAVAGAVGGRDASGTPHVWVAAQTHGTWGKAHLVAGTAGGDISALSCPRDGDCTAVGSIVPGKGKATLEAPLVVSENGGAWGKPKVIGTGSLLGFPSFRLTSVSCTKTGDCSASGEVDNDASDAAFASKRTALVTETNGTWGAPSLVPGLPAPANPGGPVIADNTASGIWCQAPGDCTVAGDYEVAGTTKVTAAGAFIATQVNGTWQKAILLRGTGSGYSSTAASCGKARDCALLLQTAAARSVLTAQQVNGVVGAKAVALPGFAALNSHAGSGNFAAGPVVSCTPSGYCAAGGQYDGAGAVGYQPFVAVKTAAGWHAAQRVHGLPRFIGGTAGATITHIDCTASGYCTAAGYYATAAGFSAFVLNEATASATTLTLSTGTVAEGRETTEHLTVTVKSPSGTPAGVVTVKAGKSTVCEIALKAGQGSCTLKASQLKPGSYKLTAAYSGSARYIPSTSAAKVLKVTK